MVQIFESVELILYGAVGVMLVVIALVALAGEVDNIVSYFVTDTPIIGLNLSYRRDNRARAADDRRWLYEDQIH